MFKVYRIIAVTLGLALLPDYGFAQATTENQPRQEESAGDPDTNSGSQNSSPIDLSAALESIESAIRDLIAEEDKIAAEAKQNRESRDLEAQEGMARWAELMFYATAATVALTLAALFAIIRTLHHTRRAADSADGMLIEAAKTTSVTSRAWINTRLDSALRSSGDSQHWHVTVNIENIGNSPAFDVSTNMTIKDCLLESKQELRKFVDFAIADLERTKDSSGGRSLFHGVSYERDWSLALDEGEVIGILGVINPIILGCVTYRTLHSDQIHITAFAYVIEGSAEPLSEDVIEGVFVTHGGFAT